MLVGLVVGLVSSAGRAGCTLVSQREGRTEDGFIYIYVVVERFRGVGFANAGVRWDLSTGCYTERDMN